MTKHTKWQIVVNSKEEIMHYFEVAGYEDCRINAYPTFLSKAEEQDFKKGINLNLFAPNVLLLTWMQKDSSLIKNFNIR